MPPPAHAQVAGPAPSAPRRTASCSPQPATCNLQPYAMEVAIACTQPATVHVPGARCARDARSRRQLARGVPLRLQQAATQLVLVLVPARCTRLPCSPRLTFSPPDSTPTSAGRPASCRAMHYMHGARGGRRSRAARPAPPTLVLHDSCDSRGSRDSHGLPHAGGDQRWPRRCTRCAPSPAPTASRRSRRSRRGATPAAATRAVATRAAARA